MEAGKLESEVCDFVTDSDLQKGKELICRFKGTPYTVKVVDIHGMLAINYLQGQQFYRIFIT